MKRHRFRSLVWPVLHVALGTAFGGWCVFAWMQYNAARSGLSDLTAALVLTDGRPLYAFGICLSLVVGIYGLLLFCKRSRFSRSA
jgi:hypothetical protein